MVATSGGNGDGWGCWRRVGVMETGGGGGDGWGCWLGGGNGDWWGWWRWVGVLATLRFYKLATLQAPTILRCLT